MPPELVVRSRRVVTPGGVEPASIHIRQGRIAVVAAYEVLPSDVPLFDAGESVVMPGLVDTHVHINEPGRTEWEGFHTATRAAAAGAITAVIEMPLNAIPATTAVAALQEKLRAAEGQCHVDVGFWGGVVPGNTSELRGLWEAGVFGFKCFLVPSGVPEFAHVTEADLRGACPVLSAVGAPLLAHAELPGPIESATAAARNAPPTSHATWLASRPRAAEVEAIELLLRLSREYGTRVHIVHLSASDALAALRRARQEQVRVTVETCPHYLCLAAEDIPDGATEFKCAPPIRERANCEQLWEGLADGTIDFVATDHSPSPPQMKCRETGDFMKAWGGIASLQLSLPAVWTQARARGFPLERLATWLCSGPARLARLHSRKGTLAAGFDADLVVWNPEASFCVEPEKLHHRHKLTPYVGQTVYGVVEATFLRGQKIFERGSFPEGPRGGILLRHQC